VLNDIRNLQSMNLRVYLFFAYISVALRDKCHIRPELHEHRLEVEEMLEYEIIEYTISLVR